MPRDIDLSYFDAAELTPARDDEIEAALRALAPDLPWEAKNQAAVHLWYPARFGLEVAPRGLDDLLGGVCRHNPARVTADFYRERAGKDWRARWPRLRFVSP